MQPAEHQHPEESLLQVPSAPKDHDLSLWSDLLLLYMQSAKPDEQEVYRRSFFRAPVPL